MRASIFGEVSNVYRVIDRLLIEYVVCCDRWCRTTSGIKAALYGLTPERATPQKVESATMY